MNLTFKQSEEWLYHEIVSHSNKSGFVKDILSTCLKPVEKGKSCTNEVAQDSERG